MPRWLTAAVGALVLAFVPAQAGLGAQAGPDTLPPLFKRTEAAFEEFVGTVGPTGTGPEASRAFGTYANELREIRGELAALDWPEDGREYRDALLVGYDRIAADAEAAGAGDITPQEFVFRVQQHAAYLQGQIDQQAAAAAQRESGPLAFLDGWPFPLSEWWFWLLVIFGPVVPIAWMIVYGAGAGVAGVFRWMQRRRTTGE